MTIEIKDFTEFTLGSRKELMRHYARYPVNHSEKLYTTMISWMGHTRYLYLLEKGNLIIMSEFEGMNFFRLPSGDRNPDVLADLLNLAKSKGGTRPVVGVEEDDIEWVSATYPDIKFSLNPNYYDYVYLANDLAELAGGEYAKIRNRISKFRRNYDFEVEDISEDNFDDVINFLERWCQWKDCKGEPLLSHESDAIRFSFDHLFELEMEGLAVRVDGIIQGISLWEAMNPETAVIHYEKAMPDFDGIYQLINQESARLLATDFKFINRQSDLGKPGLREAKTRYHPHHMVEVSYVSRNDLIF